MASSRRAFVLPFVLLLAGGLVFLAALAVREAAAEARRERLRLLHREARQLLRLQLPALERFLHERLASPPAASALVPRGGAFRPVAVAPTGARALAAPLPANAEPESPAVHFVTERLSKPLVSALLPLPEDAGGPKRQLAFAFEDLSLGSGAKAPSWYPLPGWSYAPLPAAEEMEALAQKLFPDDLSLPMPAGEGPLFFRPDTVPPLGPVLREGRLRAGLFAAGNLDRREKEVRVRFYFSGVFWNPWNRPLRLHEGEGEAPFAKIAVHGLPAVRIENRSLGRDSGWRSLDEAANAFSGKRGLSAWIESPAVLGPGEHFSFFVPNPKQQPEGLARTVHPAFPVRPADEIHLQWKAGQKGITLALLSVAENDPPAAARNGKGWLRWENLEVNLPGLSFSRADAEPAPFFLPGGSLSFRRDSAQWELRLAPRGKLHSFKVDPRQSVVDATARYTTPEGTEERGKNWLQAEVSSLRLGQPVQPPPEIPGGALFSYPAANPLPSRVQLDQPRPSTSFRLGSAGADALNRLLDHPGFPGFFSTAKKPLLLSLPKIGVRLPFAPVHPVNAPFPTAWEEWFAEADLAPATPGLRLSLFTRETGPTSHFPVTKAAAEAAGRSLAEQARTNPVPSVAFFHTAGRLPGAFREAGVGTFSPAFPLLPLRAFGGRAAPLVRHGPAWVLHLAILTQDETHAFRHSAKVWYQAIPEAEGGDPRFKRIRFQWTDPEEHLPLTSLPPHP